MAADKPTSRRPTSSEQSTSIIQRDQLVTWPNLFTFVRLLVIPLFGWFMYGNQLFAGAVLLAVLGSTDWVDGWLARVLDQRSEFGAVFDPSVDRLLVLVAILASLAVGALPVWLGLAALAREILVSVLAGIRIGVTGRPFAVTTEGKTGAFLLMFALPLFIAAAADESTAAVLGWLAWFCAAPGIFYVWYSFTLQYIPDFVKGLR